MSDIKPTVEGCIQLVEAINALKEIGSAVGLSFDGFNAERAFSSCPALTTAPSEIFSGCPSLTTMPRLCSHTK